MAILSTPNDPALLEIIKNVMPDDFVAGADDTKLLGFADLVINDMNWFMPTTIYTRANYPAGWTQTIVLGVNMFAQLFKQMEVTLQDFGYSDSGLSLNLDQVGKINTSHANMLKIYAQQVEFIKKSMLLQMGVGLGTPRFQSQIGQFMKLALGSSFNWGN